MSNLVITQNAEGTLLHGSARGDGTAEIVKIKGFRWSGRLGAWYYPRNRRVLMPTTIEALADRLRAGGHEVTVEIEDATVADREMARVERSEDRQEALEAKAVRKEAAGDAHYAASRAVTDNIPFGQPILVGHHSEGRHRRALDRSHSQMGKAIEDWRAGEEAARKAQAAESHRQQTAPLIMRRMERMGAEMRILQRRITPCPISGRKIKPGNEGRTITCPTCYHPVTVGDDLQIVSHGAVTGGQLKLDQERIAEYEAQLAYWQEQLDTLQANGVRIFSRDNIKKGDEVLTRFGDWRPVLRVNPKSVTVPTDYSWTDTMPYDRIKDVRTPVPVPVQEIPHE